MAEEKKEPWLNYLALTTVVFAVCATLSTFKGGNYSTRSVLAHGQASNFWAYYQAKSIKSYLYELQKENYEFEAKERRPALSEASIKEYDAIIESYAKKIKKYDDDKNAISKDAKEQEQIREDAQKHSGIFGIAVIYLQVAILLSSIAALLKKKPLWFLGLVVGAIGMVYFVDGFFLFL